MRQVFASPRLENVEGVATLLREAGIEVRVTGGRSYRGAIRGNFSYRDGRNAGPQPAVWIIHAEDRPRARQLLRDAGLLHPSRTPEGSYLPPTVHAGGDVLRNDPRSRRATRIKFALLGTIAVVMAVGYMAMRKPGIEGEPAAAAPTAPTTAPAPVILIEKPETTYVIATPPALAETVAMRELQRHASTSACLSIDGKDPPADVLSRLGKQHVVQAGSSCDASKADLQLDVGPYQTDGSGTGTVQVRITGQPSGKNETMTLTTTRNGHAWHVAPAS